MAAEGFDRFVVVDVETTGLYNSDRVVEVAAVTLAKGGEIVDEWDTLVNPGRDVGPTHIHGVTASMVSAAPRFEEVAEALAARLDGAVLVAHNLVFDARMLTNEYGRLGAAMDPGRGVCTRCMGWNCITIIVPLRTRALRHSCSPPPSAGWTGRHQDESIVSLLLPAPALSVGRRSLPMPMRACHIWRE
jgi:hypothetical protein